MLNRGLFLRTTPFLKLEKNENLNEIDIFTRFYINILIITEMLSHINFRELYRD